MSEFFTMLEDSLRKTLANNYVGTIVGTLPLNDDGRPLKIENIIDLGSLQTHTDFLSNVPKEAYAEVINQLVNMIMNIAFYNLVIEHMNDKIKSDGSGKEPKPRISTDLKTLKKFKTLISKYFNSMEFRGKHVVGYHFDGRFKQITYLPSYDLNMREKHFDGKKDYNIDDLFEIVDLMINDLETKEFLFLPNDYYQADKHSLNYYNKIFIEISKKYHLKDYRKNIKDFIENFNSTIRKTP